MQCRIQGANECPYNEGTRCLTNCMTRDTIWCTRVRQLDSSKNQKRVLLLKHKISVNFQSNYTYQFFAFWTMPFFDIALHSVSHNIYIFCTKINVTAWWWGQLRTETDWAAALQTSGTKPDDWTGWHSLDRTASKTLGKMYRQNDVLAVIQKRDEWVLPRTLFCSRDAVDVSPMCSLTSCQVPHFSSIIKHYHL